MFSCLFVVALWAPAVKGLTSWFYVCDDLLCFVTFLWGVLGQEWCLIVSISDLCLLLNLIVSKQKRIHYSCENGIQQAS